jgi:predicted Zn-dependent protease
MNIRRLFAIAAVAGGLLSCSDATAPSRASIYEWRLVASIDTVHTDTLSFHWPASMLPVRIWVQDSLDMPAHIQDAIGTWRAAFLYGEYDAVLVTDSLTADVIVRVGPLPAKAAATVGGLHAMFPGCEGETDLDIPTRFQLQLPVRMTIHPKYDPATTDLSECFAIVTTHELGHSLGIFRHSGDTLDIMYGDPQVTAPSARDVNTATVLSHWPANLIPTR